MAFPAAAWSAIRRIGLDHALLAAAETGDGSAVQSVWAAVGSADHALATRPSASRRVTQ
jgi:hypothetical protein